MVEFVYKEPEFRLSDLNFDIFITFTSPNQNIARSARTLQTASLSLLQIPHIDKGERLQGKDSCSIWMSLVPSLPCQQNRD